MNSIKFEVGEKIHLKKFLKTNNVSNRAIKDLFSKKLIKVNSNRIGKNIILNKNDKVLIEIEDENLNYKPIYKSLDILYEDSHIIAVTKMANLTVNSKNQENLSNYLAGYFKENKIKSQVRLINRLDMNTSGIMLIAKNKYAQAFYQKQIEDGLVNKSYLSLVEGRLDIDKIFETRISYDKNNKKMIEDDSGKLIKTHFKTVKVYENFSLIKCRILTGKTHQIRISLSLLKHPILGDKLYGSTYTLDRFLLHSYKLEFSRFLDKEKIRILSRPTFDKYLNLNN